VLLELIHSQADDRSSLRRWAAIAAILLAFAADLRAQGVIAPDTTWPTYVFAGIAGFIPTQEGYRINYSTSLAGLPIELNAGLIFPATPGVFVPLTVRYLHREAKFISGTTISVLSIEPGVRFFLERARANDLRLFGAIEALFARAIADGTIDATHDGANPSEMLAESQFLNYGVGVDLGLTYALNPNSSLDGLAHVATYFGSTVDHGGLGDIGGVSLVIDCRVGF
jgi:hypothetical protein